MIHTHIHFKMLTADFKFGGVDAPVEDCPICHRPVDRNDIRVVNPCGHCFCDTCIKSWTTTNHTCPWECGPIDSLTNPNELGTCGVCKEILTSESDFAILKSEPNKVCDHVFHVRCLKNSFKTHRLECPTCYVIPVISMINRSGETELLLPITWYLSPPFGSHTNANLSIRTTENDVVELIDEQSLCISQSDESQHEILLPETKTLWTRKLCIVWNPDEEYPLNPNPHPSKEDVLRLQESMAEIDTIIKTHLAGDGMNHYKQSSDNLYFPSPRRIRTTRLRNTMEIKRSSNGVLVEGVAERKFVEIKWTTEIVERLSSGLESTQPGVTLREPQWDGWKQLNEAVEKIQAFVLPSDLDLDKTNIKYEPWMRFLRRKASPFVSRMQLAFLRVMDSSDLQRDFEAPEYIEG